MQLARVSYPGGKRIYIDHPGWGKTRPPQNHTPKQKKKNPTQNSQKKKKPKNTGTHQTRKRKRGATPKPNQRKKKKSFWVLKKKKNEELAKFEHSHVMGRRKSGPGRKKAH